MMIHVSGWSKPTPNFAEKTLPWSPAPHQGPKLLELGCLPQVWTLDVRFEMVLSAVTKGLRQSVFFSHPK